jgi:hypothetical protein
MLVRYYVQGAGRSSLGEELTVLSLMESTPILQHLLHRKNASKKCSNNTAKFIHFWSDGCGGQFMNKFLKQ